MSALLSWHNTHPEFFTNAPFVEVGVVISLSSRNVLHRALIPQNLTALLRAGVPVAALRDDELDHKKLRGLRVVTVETAACLDEPAAKALSRWVRNGGVLIAAPDTGSYDSLGRQRPNSPLWQALGLKSPPAGETAIGRGKVIAPPPAAFAGETLRRTKSYSFLEDSNSGVEVVPYRAPHCLLLHLLRHESQAAPLVIQLPASIKSAGTTAELFTPSPNSAQMLPLSAGPDGATLQLASVPAYGVIKIQLK
jgi:hypothetical protein